MAREGGLVTEEAQPPPPTSRGNHRDWSACPFAIDSLSLTFSSSLFFFFFFLLRRQKLGITASSSFFFSVLVSGFRLSFWPVFSSSLLVCGRKELFRLVDGLPSKCTGGFWFHLTSTGCLSSVNTFHSTGSNFPYSNQVSDQTPFISAPMQIWLGGVLAMVFVFRILTLNVMRNALFGFVRCKDDGLILQKGAKFFFLSEGNCCSPHLHR